MRRKCDNYLLPIVLVVILFKSLPAQTLEINIVNTGSNHIQVTGTAIGDFQAIDGTDDWSSAVITLRIPTLVGASISAPAASADVTNESNSGFGGVTLTDGFGGGLAGTKLYALTQVGAGCPSDGYVYMTLTDNTSTPNFPLSDGSTVVLFEFDLPVSWTCTECMEVVFGDIACTPFFDGTRVGNQGTGTNVAVAGDLNTSLPIELTVFEPRTNKCDVSLYWETASEKNFGYFQIEASRDGRIFTSAGQQKPASPNSTTKRVYKYSIPSNLQDHYFRLKAVDLDGGYEYSEVLYAKAPCEDKAYGLHLYPNPNYTTELMVELRSGERIEKVELHLLDAYGKLIRIQKVDQVEVGSNKIPIETADLPTGTYFIKILGIDQLQIPLKFIRSNF